MRSGSWLSILLLACAGAGTVFFASDPVQAGRKAKPGKDDALVELGRRLFFDPAASRGGKFSCADCHRPENGFSDPRRVSEDENGKTTRHSQTLIDLKDNTGFHWDGEFDDLDQLLAARLAPTADVLVQTRNLLQSHFESARARGDRPSREEFQKKMSSLTPPYYGPETPVSGTPVPQPILARLTDDGRYEDAFRAAFGKGTPTTRRLTDAVRAYLLSLESGPNRYDDYLAGHPEALTAQERSGLRLFEGKAGCAQCHVSKPDSDGFAKFTDYTFRNTGVAFRGVLPEFSGKADMDLGHGTQTFASVDIGSFKVPSLRDVARRAPFMHDGSFASLDDVLDYYQKGGTENGRLDPKVHAFDLSRGERVELLAFLHALTSKERPGLALPSAHRTDRLRVRLVGPDGRPMRDFAVKVSPFGDRLKGAPEDAKPFTATTDRSGNLEVPLPLWTHVTLTAPGYEIGYDRPLPDTLRKPLVLLTVPRREVYVEVYAPKSGKGLSANLQGHANGSGGPRVTLRRVRSLGPRHVLYRMDRMEGVKRIIASFDLGENTSSIPREIDVSGGMSEPLDYRE